jgi:hypothetical protein
MRNIHELKDWIIRDLLQHALIWGDEVKASENIVVLCSAQAYEECIQKLSWKTRGEETIR